MNRLTYQLSGVTKSYGKRQVCHIDSLEIYRGEILGIMGPNGSGKSTLLRLLHFLEPPTSGTISFLGMGVNGSLPLELKRKITMVFQHPLLLDNTVWENVAYGLKARGDREADRKVREILDRVGLLSLARARSATLSGGEMKRVALARCLVLEPEVLLLDEPAAHLDPYNGSLIEGLIREASREGQKTVVLVTHNPFQVRRLAHRVAFLMDGRIVEAGAAEALFSQPKDPRTAAFIRGEMVY